MQEAKIDIQPTDSLAEAVAKVEQGYEELGASLLAFENLNTYLPISPFCRFFQASFPDREVVLIVMTGEWEEKVLLTILNVLLEIRMDPDPPGRLPLFRFHAAEAVPPVLKTLFGDAAVSEFESRAVLVVHFGRDLDVDASLQLAAVARHLLRECLGVATDCYAPDAVAKVDATVAGAFREAGFEEEGAPLNALVSVGFLYGEILRGRFDHASRWVRLQNQGPWPVLVFGSLPPPQSPEEAPDDSEGTGEDDGTGDSEGTGEGDAKEASEGPASAHVVFNPIGVLIALYKEGKPGRLERAADELERRLGEELQAPSVTSDP